MTGPQPSAARPIETDATRSVRRATWHVDVSSAVPLPGRFEIAVDVVAPTEVDPTEPSVVLACLPGGFLSRRYFDLSENLSENLSEDLSKDDSGGLTAGRLSGESSGASSVRGYSFAQAMASYGFVTLAFDHLGVGESSKPDPIEGGYALGAPEIAAANQRALELALEKLALGDPGAGIAARPNPTTWGVGHSMGSALSVEQQAMFETHRGLILFSFTTEGVPRFLTAAQKRYAHDPRHARAELARLTRENFGTPYPGSPQDSQNDQAIAFGIGTAPPSAEASLRGVATNLLGTTGLLSMIPDGYAAAADEIAVPVLIALGDHDLHDARGLVEMLPRSPGVTIFELDDCWHCHFVANTHARLFSRVAEWIHTEIHSGSSRLRAPKPKHVDPRTHERENQDA